MLGKRDNHYTTETPLDTYLSVRAGIFTRVFWVLPNLVISSDFSFSVSSLTVYLFPLTLFVC